MGGGPFGPPPIVLYPASHRIFFAFPARCFSRGSLDLFLFSFYYSLIPRLFIIKEEKK